MEYASEHVMAEFITAKFMDGLLKNVINTKQTNKLSMSYIWELNKLYKLMKSQN